MTSDCAGDQVSQKPNGLTSVKATSAIGGHDRLNEAPQVLECNRCSCVFIVLSGKLAHCPGCAAWDCFVSHDFA